MSYTESIAKNPGKTLALLVALAIVAIYWAAKTFKYWRQCRKCEGFASRARMENGVCGVGWDPAAVAETQALEAVGGIEYKAAAEKRLNAAIHLQ